MKRQLEALDRRISEWLTAEEVPPFDEIEMWLFVIRDLIAELEE